jgi:hypothetical protein
VRPVPVREQLVPHEEPAAASAELLAAEKAEAMSEGHMRVGTDVKRGVRLVSVFDSPSAAAVVVRPASVSPVVRFHWPQQAGLPAYIPPRTPPSASHFELSQQEQYRLSQQEPYRLRLVPAAG